MSIKQQRTDIHRPSAIEPAKYAHIHSFCQPPEPVEVGFVLGEIGARRIDELTKELDLMSGKSRALDLYREGGVAIHGGIFSCDACGAHYKNGSLYRHENGEVISLGYDCADNLDMGYPIAQANSLKASFGELTKRRREQLARFAGLKFWLAQQSVELRIALKSEHYIVREIRGTLIKFGASPRLSSKQVALILKLDREQRERDAQPEEVHVPVPVDGERIEVTGVVVGTKMQDSMYGSTYKMTVKVETPDGSWLVYGSVPSAVSEQLTDAHDVARHQSEETWDAGYAAHKAARAELLAREPRTKEHQLPDYKHPEAERQPLRGSTVTFTAKVVRGDRDEHFGFFSRPSKASVKLVERDGGGVIVEKS